MKLIGTVTWPDTVPSPDSGLASRVKVSLPIFGHLLFLVAGCIKVQSEASEIMIDDSTMIDISAYVDFAVFHKSRSYDIQRA